MWLISRSGWAQFELSYGLLCICRSLHVYVPGGLRWNDRETEEWREGEGSVTLCLPFGPRVWTWEHVRTCSMSATDYGALVCITSVSSNALETSKDSSMQHCVVFSQYVLWNTRTHVCVCTVYHSVFELWSDSLSCSSLKTDSALISWSLLVCIENDAGYYIARAFVLAELSHFSYYSIFHVEITKHNDIHIIISSSPLYYPWQIHEHCLI